MADDGEPDEPDWGYRIEEPSGLYRAAKMAGQGLVVGTALLSPVLIGLVVYALLPPEAPTFRDPSTLDAVFASRFTILLVRIGILFGTIYAVVSVVALICRRQWLSSVGPFKVSESMRTLETDQKTLAQELDDALVSIEQLRDAGDDALNVIEMLDELLADAQRELDEKDRAVTSLKEQQDRGTHP
ncbi:MAG: hypothetical protein M3Y04_02735 [Actinomycetota bacterium]|nr:hypothetical protein [Actinomycetota bacterium]